MVEWIDETDLHKFLPTDEEILRRFEKSRSVKILDAQLFVATVKDLLLQHIKFIFQRSKSSE